MPDTAGRLDPAPAWTVLTDAPLKGLMLAREARLVLAWDEARQLYLFDLLGRPRGTLRVAESILAAALSDDGARIAVLAAGPTIQLFGPEFEPIADRAAPPDATALALDPHGLYLAVASRLGLTQLYNRHGRVAGRFETRQPLNHLAFVPGRPVLLGAATFGMLFGFALHAQDSGGRLDVEELWHEELHANIGRLTTTGDGGMVLASCYSHGVLRYDLAGRHEGAYHLGGTAAQAAPDFAGRLIAVATVEGELALLNSAGNVRWKTALARPVNALETDALGEFLIYGHATGEIIRLDLSGAAKPASTSASATDPKGQSRAGSASMRTPAWSVPVAKSDEQAESAVLAVLDDPSRIGLVTSNNKLQIYTADGTLLGQASELLGVGRFVRTAPGWMAAATDRQVVLFDARRGLTQRLDLSLVEITHLAIEPDSYGLAVVQERDRLGRATREGRWVWKTELRAAIEELALGPRDSTAVTTTAGRLLVFDGTGAVTERPLGDVSDPACVIAAPDGAPEGVAWLTLTRREQVLRGHDLSGRPLWEAPVPWEGWQLLRLGALALVAAPDGRALTFDGAGNLRGQSQGQGNPTDLFFAGARDVALRVSRGGIHLICGELSGRVAWRAVADGPIGPCAVGRSGVAVLIGRALAWFPMLERRG